MDQNINIQPAQDTTDDAHSRKSWLIWLAVLCIGIIGYGFLFSTNDTNDTAYLLGYNTAIGAMLSGIFRLTFSKSIAGQRAWFTYAAIFGSLMLGSHLAYMRNSAIARESLHEVKKGYETLIASNTDPSGFPKVVEKPLDTTTKTTGDMGAAEQFSKRYMNDLVALQNEYLTKISDMGWQSILDPERIKDDTSLNESLARVKLARELVTTYRHKTIDYAKSGHDQIMALNASPKFKQEMAAGFDESFKKTQIQMEISWGYEEKIVNEVGNIFLLLSSRRDSWEINGGKFLFANQSDLDTYTASIARINDYTQKQMAIRKDSIDTARKHLSGLD